MKWKIYNDLFHDRHNTHVTSEKDKDTIMNDIDTWITTEKLH